MVREKIKSFSRDALLYGIGNALGRLVGLVMLPILTRAFTPVDYGAIDLLTVSFAFLIILLKLGVPSALQRYYFRMDDEERRTMVTSAVSFLSLAALATAAVLALSAGAITSSFEEQPPGLRSGVTILAFCLPIEMLWENSVLLLRLRRRAVIFSGANVARVVITPTLTYVFVVTMGRGIEGVFLAKIVSLTLLAVVLVVVTRREYAARISPAAFRMLLAFGLPGHPGLVIRSSMNILPRYLLAAMAPLASVGLFGIGLRICSVMKVFVGSFNLAWNPFAFENEGSPDERRIYEIVFKVFYGAMLSLSLVLALFAGEVLRLLTPAGSSYLEARVLVPGIALYLGIEGLTTILSTILYTRNRVRWASYLNGIRVTVFLVVAVLLTPRWHAFGLVMALDLSAIAYLVAYLARTQSLFAFEIPWKGIVSTTAVAVGLGWALFNLDLGLWWSLAVKILGVSAFVASSTALIVTRKEWRVFAAYLGGQFSAETRDV